MTQKVSRNYIMVFVFFSYYYRRMKEEHLGEDVVARPNVIQIFDPYSAGIDFKRYNLVSVDVRF